MNTPRKPTLLKRVVLAITLMLGITLAVPTMASANAVRYSYKSCWPGQAVGIRTEIYGFGYISATKSGTTTGSIQYVNSPYRWTTTTMWTGYQAASLRVDASSPDGNSRIGNTFEFCYQL